MDIARTAATAASLTATALARLAAGHAAGRPVAAVGLRPAMATVNYGIRRKLAEAKLSDLHDPAYTDSPQSGWTRTWYGGGCP